MGDSKSCSLPVDEEKNQVLNPECSSRAVKVYIAKKKAYGCSIDFSPSPQFSSQRGKLLGHF